jgi:uncharacterized RDD family membrane protein YckC
MSEDSLKGNYAGFVSRLIAFSIDVIIVVFTLMFMGWLINAVLGIFNIDEFSSTSMVNKLLVSGAISLLYSAAYFLFFWTIIGQTPGKILMGLRIVTTDGQTTLSFTRSVRRLLGYIVSILSLWIGFLWILVDNRRQGWHDKIAGTIVIYVWDARAGSFITEWYRQRQEDGQHPEHGA